MKYYILTLGCQMNISDSQRIATKLEETGYKSAPEKDADLVVVNACSVRQHAVDRIWGLTKKWQKEGKKILITGCVLPTDKRKFSNRDIATFNIKDLPRLDSVIARIRRLTETKQSIKDRRADARDDIIDEYFNIPMKLSGKIAYIPIMTGCDNFCSYCAVPYTRGREISRPLDDILVEVKTALDQGFKEIWLLGQNVNSYNPTTAVIARSEATRQSIKKDRHATTVARDDKNNMAFIELLTKVDNLDSDFKFNFMSSNPHDMGPDLIECFAKLKKWTKELHLPLQSGDDEILRKMNRKYDSNQYLALISNLKSKIPASPAGRSNLKLSTDIIVGFPTETKTQFENTVKVCKKVGFWKVFIGQYSPRPGTVSAKMTDDVSAEEKKRRWLKLDQLINK